MGNGNYGQAQRKGQSGLYRKYTLIWVLITALLIASPFCVTQVKAESRAVTASYQKLYGDIEDIEEIKKGKKEKENEEEEETQEQSTSQKEKQKESQTTTQQEGQATTRHEGQATVTTEDKARDNTEEKGTTQKKDQSSDQTQEQESTTGQQDPEEDQDQTVLEPKSYEVHLLLDSSQVLDENYLLKQAILEQFDADDDYKSFALAYYETPDRQFNQEGWINRIRMREDKPKKNFKITFKKRYSVSGEDYSAAMKQMESEGFDLKDKNWETQVEWNYSSMVLSISSEADGGTDGRKSMDELALDDALAMLKDNMPDQELNWKSGLWGGDTLQSALMGGPVRFKRYSGSYQDVDVDIEVRNIKDPKTGTDHYITELSFKEKNYDQAAGIRSELIKSLGDQGILLEKDGLKTQQILDIYFPLD